MKLRRLRQRPWRLQRQAEALLQIFFAHPRALFRRTIRRGIKLDSQPALPADFIQMRLDCWEVHAAVAQWEEWRVFHHIGPFQPRLRSTASLRFRIFHMEFYDAVA